MAIDVDPDANLLAAMGHPQPTTIPPLVGLKDLIEERTGAKPGTVGGMFTLNPKVDDIPAKYAVDLDGIQVLVAGAVKTGGTGCYCPENAFVRAPGRSPAAGSRHRSRHGHGSGHRASRARHRGAVDMLLIVVEPGRRSLETATRIRTLAADLGLERIGVVGNRVRSDADREFLSTNLPDLNFLGFVPYDEALRQAEWAGESVAKASPQANAEIELIVAAIAETANI